VTTSAPRVSVVVPSLGLEPGLSRLLAALDAQTLGRERFEVIVALDGVPAGPADDAIVARGARIVRLAARGGPGAARNAGERAARAELLAFTEDDCTPAPDWLERALARFDADAALEVLCGVTTKPGDRPVHRQQDSSPLYLPTNLFVKRATFERVGGYSELYFDAARRLYFREDSDFGFTLEAEGAHIARAADVRVVHPEEHARPIDALRWADRHEMDPLLAHRHPQAFRDRIEVHRVGPLVVRRPIVRAAVVVAAGTLLAIAATLGGRADLAPLFGLVALAGQLVIWAKWRFAPSHLGVGLAVPYVLLLALARGTERARKLVPVVSAAPRPARGSS